MKPTINTGAYGWHHPHWLDTFYPDDLPADWRLGYYSNEFNAVLIPADYWPAGFMLESEGWLDQVHPGFQFYIECHERMFDNCTLAEIEVALTPLLPQVSGLVLSACMETRIANDDRFIELADALAVDVFTSGVNPAVRSGVQRLWCPGQADEDVPLSSTYAHLAIIEDSLCDLRATRSVIEPFLEQLPDDETGSAAATVIVSHSELRASDLNKFRSVLEIMGY